MEDIYDFEKYEFGIIDDLEKEKNNLSDPDDFYDPNKYDCITLLEDFWWTFYKDTKYVETLNVKNNFKKNKGFENTGASIVTTSTNLNELKKCVENQRLNKKRVMESVKDATLNEEFDEEFDLLLEIINKAIKENKSIIFYAN